MICSMAKEKPYHWELTKREKFGRTLQIIGLLSLSLIALAESFGLALPILAAGLGGGELLKASGSKDRLQPNRKKLFGNLFSRKHKSAGGH